MKMLVVSLMIWIFIVPCAITIALVAKSLSPLVPNIYLIFVFIAIAFATLAIMWGPVLIPNSSGKGSENLKSGGPHTPGRNA
jgi:hypothetical protein